MGNQKQKWTAEEEEALLNGIAKHGPGKWKNILKDPDFAPYLTQRSNIDLKDKWRNLSVSNAGKGSKDKSRGANKVKVLTVTPSSNSNVQNSVPADGSVDILMDDQSNNASDGKNAPRYNAMIFEALSTIKDTNGCDISAIVHFVELLLFSYHWSDLPDVMGKSDSNTETRTQAHLDAQEEQIKNIMEQLAALNRQITASQQSQNQFQGLVLQWMKRMEKQPVMEEDKGTPGHATVSHGVTEQSIPVPTGYPPPDFGRTASIEDATHMTKKVKLPTFSGTDRHGRLTRAETYFQIHCTPEQQNYL